MLMLFALLFAPIRVRFSRNQEEDLTGAKEKRTDAPRVNPNVP